ncbi:MULTISPECIES: hypothetical protein [Geobacillus]|uniref:Uncharacterized protein n=1 Tax=Geobacillus zalihae TaxID=213419 RepID=A0A7H1RWX3_9BACL|nr:MULTISPECIES: hypothetical protein [Geobacillus]QNU18762.1 hypothetical protein IC807_03570 [Geobacillus zalihae]QNU24902.1 hypothetical protein IC806_00730 [Geobacillus zalihae]WKA48776.1 hypothetical protein QWV57_07490 [Geobacillus zalihae]
MDGTFSPPFAFTHVFPYCSTQQENYSWEWKKTDSRPNKKTAVGQLKPDDGGFLFTF